MSKTDREQYRGVKKMCVCCETEFLAAHGGRKYCDRCVKRTPTQREAFRYKMGLTRKAPKSLYYIECVRCGAPTERTNHNQKFCPECHEEIMRQRNAGSHTESYGKPKRIAPPSFTSQSRKAMEESVLLNYHDLSGKSANRISAEAAAFGFGSSYGKYVSCVQIGMIDRWLRDKGITDPVAVLREIKTK